MKRPPDGFSVHARGGATAWLRDDVAAALLAAGFDDPEALRDAAHAQYQGRGAAFGVEAASVGPVFVRPYRHGGVLRHVTADLYAGEGRFEDEVVTLTHAATAGVPVPEVLGFVARNAGLGMRRGWLLTREVEDGADLLAYLEADPPAGQRRATLATAGRVIRKLHDAGVEHPDLHFKNLLRRGDGGVLVIDLDSARLRGELTPARRLAGLFRFDRYAAKQVRRGALISRVDRMRVLRSYAGTDWPQRDELRSLATRLAEHIARHGHASRQPTTTRRTA